MFEKQSIWYDCDSLILVLIMTYGQDLLHRLVKALLIFLTLYVANYKFATCEDQGPVDECQAFET